MPPFHPSTTDTDPASDLFDRIFKETTLKETTSSFENYDNDNKQIVEKY